MKNCNLDSTSSSSLKPPSMTRQSVLRPSWDHQSKTISERWEKTREELRKSNGDLCLRRSGGADDANAMNCSCKVTALFVSSGKLYDSSSIVIHQVAKELRRRRCFSYPTRPRNRCGASGSGIVRAERPSMIHPSLLPLFLPLFPHCNATNENDKKRRAR